MCIRFLPDLMVSAKVASISVFLIDHFKKVSDTHHASFVPASRSGFLTSCSCNGSFFGRRFFI
jgi:hypothetical protein